MANCITVCRSCDRTKSEPDPSSEPGDLDITSLVICGRCVDAMEGRYSRPAHAAGLPTLGDFLLEAHARRVRAMEEALDSDIRDVFPRLSDDAKPALRRSMRDDPQLEDALGRVGGWACLTAPDRFGPDYADGPFLIAGLNGDGKACLNQADWHRMFGYESQCVNAYDYAPDGTLLRGG